MEDEAFWVKLKDGRVMFLFSCAPFSSFWHHEEGRFNVKLDDVEKYCSAQPPVDF